MRHLQLVDSLLGGQALVFGSLPPQARDLDLLVRPEEEEALRRGLSDEGFVPRGGSWVRLGPEGPEIVDPASASSWGLPAAELAELYRESSPLPGCEQLVQPSPHHVLLILARRLVRAGGTLEARHRARVDAALAADPAAWRKARSGAPAWGASSALSVLESAYQSGGAVPLAARLGAARAELRRERGLPGSAAAAARVFVRRPRLGCVVSLSGLDGAGKSSQAACVRDALEQLGQHAVAVWPAIDAPSWLLPATARIARRLLALRRRSGAGLDASPDAVGRSVREGSRVLTLCWSLLVSLRGALRLARKTWPHVARGRVVICDRYLLDSWVYLAHQYGERSEYRLQLSLLSLLAPRPRRAYLLEVTPEEATARQPERSVEENRDRARLYRDLAPRLGVRPIDGQRPRETICADIAGDVWRSLT